MKLSMRSLELRVLQLSERIGLPTDPVFRLIRARRVIGGLKDWRERRKKADAIRLSSPYAKTIDRTKGFFVFNGEFLPEISEAVGEAARLYEAKQHEISVSDAKKRFFMNIMTPADLDKCVKITALANHSAMYETAAAYLGTFPKLRSVGVYVSEANTSQISSQMFHYDTNDLTQVKCFINVNDVDPENGPFTFLSAEISKGIGSRRMGGRVDDKEVFARISEEDLVSLTGPAGTGAFVDTSKCLHYGSRCRSGRRIVIMIQYTPHPDLSMKMEKYSRKGTPLLISDGH